MPRVNRQTTGPSSFPIRPMYGIAIRDDLRRFRIDIGSTAQNIRDALAKGKPNAKEKVGDGVLQGREYKYAATALKEVDKAVKALKSVPDLPTFPAAPPATTSAPRIPIRPMYGIAIRDDLRRFRNEIATNLSALNDAIAKGKPNAREKAGDGVLQGKELLYAKKAAAQLEVAMKALKSIPPTF